MTYLLEHPELIGLIAALIGLVSATIGRRQIVIHQHGTADTPVSVRTELNSSARERLMRDLGSVVFWSATLLTLLAIGFVLDTMFPAPMEKSLFYFSMVFVWAFLFSLPCLCLNSILTLFSAFRFFWGEKSGIDMPVENAHRTSLQAITDKFW